MLFIWPHFIFLALRPRTPSWEYWIWCSSPTDKCISRDALNALGLCEKYKDFRPGDLPLGSRGKGCWVLLLQWLCLPDIKGRKLTTLCLRAPGPSPGIHISAPLYLCASWLFFLPNYFLCFSVHVARNGHQLLLRFPSYLSRKEPRQGLKPLMPWLLPPWPSLGQVFTNGPIKGGWVGRVMLPQIAAKIPGTIARAMAIRKREIPSECLEELPIHSTTPGWPLSVCQAWRLVSTSWAFQSLGFFLGSVTPFSTGGTFIFIFASPMLSFHGEVKDSPVLYSLCKLLRYTWSRTLAKQVR